jgi:hypothetical protein
MATRWIQIDLQIAQMAYHPPAMLRHQFQELVLLRRCVTQGVSFFGLSVSKPLYAC